LVIWRHSPLKQRKPHIADDQDVAHPFPQGAVRPPRRRSRKKLHALLADALNAPVFVTVDDPVLSIIATRRRCSRQSYHVAAVWTILITLQRYGQLRL
jgi:hypothetical protein